MLVLDCVYLSQLFITLFSLVVFIYSVNNKNRYACNYIIVISIVFLLYLFINIYLREKLYLPTGLEVLIIYTIDAIMVILSITSIVESLVKKKKLKISTKNNKVILATIFLSIVPAIFLSTCVIENKQAMDNSDLVVSFSSHGNGGFGDCKDFAYAIGKDYCKQIDIGIEGSDLYLEKFVPKGAIEINKNRVSYSAEYYESKNGYHNDETDKIEAKNGIYEINNLENSPNYKIVINDDARHTTTIIYKDNKEFCKIDNKSHYFNIDFEKGFYTPKYE